MRKKKRGKSSSLGMPEAPHVNIQGDSSIKACGFPGRHPLFLQQVSVCFRIRSVCALCASLGASFAFSFHFSFMHHDGIR